MSKTTTPTMQLKMPKDVEEFRSVGHIREFYNMVKEFHEVFNHPVESKSITPELLTLRANLIREEAKEGIEAIERNDGVEMLDAVGDVIYVMSGTLVAIRGALFGATTYHLNKGSIASVVMYSPTSNFKDDLSTLFKHSLQTADLLDKAADLLKRRKEEKANIELGSAMYAIADALHAYQHVITMSGVNCIEMVRAIHESNMSKLWSADLETRLNQIEKCKYDKTDLAFNVCLSRDGMIGYRISDGKILKSPSYTAVDLGRFVSDCTEL
ncbi:nucleoside triphosphate pyrophosphohydrolase family protein [Providencia manganoxydans]|uniref:nucleoside triphosphate pyrophosphohydrolase family protein n=1 Tax=Providencia manganoxydans TaxID=2923283 RepID=UPI0032DAC7CB